MKTQISYFRCLIILQDFLSLGNSCHIRQVGKVTVDLPRLAGLSTEFPADRPAIYGMLNDLQNLAGQPSVLEVASTFFNHCSVTCRTWQVNRRFWEVEPPMKIILSSNLLASAGQPSLLGTAISTCQPRQVNRHFWELKMEVSATCRTWQVCRHFRDIASSCVRPASLGRFMDSK